MTFGKIGSALKIGMEGALFQMSTVLDILLVFRKENAYYNNETLLLKGTRVVFSYSLRLLQ